MIELCNVTKSYPLGKGRHYVVKNLNFTIPSNVTLGIIGRNGAGKSTLMRLLGKMEVPDSGKIVTSKSISWPVGLAGGFQHTLTGRQNVHFVAQIYGAGREEVRRTIEFVEDFAELGDYFHMPIKTYSSGMRSRLAFGLSMAFDFDYYLIDEVLSVGDAYFQEKCKATIYQKRKTSNFILASHAAGTIQEMCNMVILLERGQLTLFQDVDEAVHMYHAMIS